MDIHQQFNKSAHYAYTLGQMGVYTERSPQHTSTEIITTSSFPFNGVQGTRSEWSHLPSPE